MESRPDYLPDYLQQRLDVLPEAQRYLVGFSGGLDSHTLLHSLVSLNLDATIVAVHINHSIQKQSDQWQVHCASVARDLKVDFLAIKVDGNPPAGESPEAWARLKRYDAFSSAVEEGDILLLAQHRDDQIETFFLQLLRGSGSHGLAAMPAEIRFDNGWMARPFLDVTRQDLELYANDNGLQWIEDPSNQDYRYDRNYLRHEVIPLIRKRWPGYGTSLSRSISLQADACRLLDESAADDLVRVRGEDLSHLLIPKLLELDDARIRNLLRYWIKETGYQLPSFQKLRQIIDTVLSVAEDRSPCVEWIGVEVRRYRDQLIISPPQVQHDFTVLYRWDLEKKLELPVGILSAKKTPGNGFIVDSNVVEIRFRQGGEVFKPAGKKHTTTLKKYFQEKGIPPWIRDRTPLIYCDDQLVSVSDLCIVDQFTAQENSEGWLVSWKSF